MLIGATTENPFFEVNPPLRSRSTLFRLEPLDARRPARSSSAAGLEALGDDAPTTTPSTCSSSAAAATAARCSRRWRSPPRWPIPGPIELDHAEAALGTSAVRYGRDDHYDVISAFIKSMRGSDPDAAVYWLARMLEAGEDPRFIARRMVIFASEDVGMADPQALVVATSAAHALELVGLPEAQLNLAQAVDPPGDGAEEQPQRARPSGAPGPTSPPARSARCRRTSATATTRAPRCSATAPATSTLMTTTTTNSAAGSTSSTCPTRCRAAAGTDPSRHGHEQEVAERMERTASAGDEEDGRR